MFAPHEIRIGTLRVRRQGTGDETALRVNISRLLGGADLYPRLIPPSAVLMVRRLGDPLPGKLAAGATAIRPDPLWEAAVQSALAERYRTAARPDHGRIVGTPEAIAFSDESEMLACFALDLADGDAPRRWWWGWLVQRTGAGMAAALGDSILVLPAVLHHLATWDAAALVLAALTEDQALTLFNQLAAQVGVRDPAALPPDADPGLDDADQALTRDASADLPPQPRSRDARRAPATRRPHPTEPPWEGLIPTSLVVPRQGKAHQLLLGAALAIHHAPERVRGLAFSRRILRWWRAADAPHPDDQAGDPTPLPPAARSARQAASPGGRGGDVAPRQTLAEAQPGEAAPPLDTASTASASAAPHVEVDAPPVTPDRRAAPADRPPLFYRPQWWAEGVETRLGGALYLLNMMLALDLPDCFEASAGLASQVGAWGVLEALARALIPPGFAADPLWAGLALIAGREPGTLPGAGFLGAAEYPIPDGWPALTAPDAALAAPADPTFTGTLAAALSPGLRGWLAWVLPYVRAWLCVALDAPPTLAPNDLVAALPLTISGRLYITATHVDLVMRLDAISLAARMAGLDRDPGWQFGRVVKFYFE
jgi:hypothetical protein